MRGARVCTREGWPVRILCFDVKGGKGGILAEVHQLDSDLQEYAICQYYDNGRSYPNGESFLDLMMADDDYMEKLGRGKYGNSNIETPDWHGPHRIMTTEQIATQPFASISDENYWRRMYAGMAMQGLMADYNHNSDDMTEDAVFAAFVARRSVFVADTLIDRLKKTQK